MAKNTSVPLKLLKEFKQEKITVETSFGEIYRGVLLDAEENLSVALGRVKATLNDGNTVSMEGVYIRGNRIRFISLPDSAADYLPRLIRPPVRPKLTFRASNRDPKRGGHGSRPSYDRRY